MDLLINLKFSWLFTGLLLNLASVAQPNTSKQYAIISTTICYKYYDTKNLACIRYDTLFEVRQRLSPSKATENQACILLPGTALAINGYIKGIVKANVPDCAGLHGQAPCRQVPYSFDLLHSNPPYENNEYVVTYGSLTKITIACLSEHYISIGEERFHAYPLSNSNIIPGLKMRKLVEADFWRRGNDPFVHLQEHNLRLPKLTPFQASDILLPTSKQLLTKAVLQDSFIMRFIQSDQNGQDSCTDKNLVLSKLFESFFYGRGSSTVEKGGVVLTRGGIYFYYALPYCMLSAYSHVKDDDESDLGTSGRYVFYSYQKVLPYLRKEFRARLQNVNGNWTLPSISTLHRS